MSVPLIGFGGGCHWCTEAVFNSLIGIEQVEQGFIRSIPPTETLSEAVQIRFDPDKIPLAVLVEIHLRTHASMSNHSFREKYRSAVYTTCDIQSEEVVEIMQTLQLGFSKPLITKVLPLIEFQSSPDQYQKYYRKHAEGAFCQRYVDPKLALIRKEFSGVFLVTTDVTTPIDGKDISLDPN